MSKTSGTVLLSEMHDLLFLLNKSPRVICAHYDPFSVVGLVERKIKMVT